MEMLERFMGTYYVPILVKGTLHLALNDSTVYSCLLLSLPDGTKECMTLPGGAGDLKSHCPTC